MRIEDVLGYAFKSLTRQGFRSIMLVLSLALGVASTTVLVSLGESARSFILGEFAHLGSDVLAVYPGRKTTTGAMPPITGNAARDITLQDAAILERTVPGIAAIAPLVVGTGSISQANRERNTLVLGVNEAFFDIRRLTLARGALWHDIAIEQSAPVAVIGETLADELFAGGQVLGQWLRVRGFRFRVVGVLEGTGDSFGSDLSDALFIPVASAQQLFNSPGLFRLIVQVDDRYDRQLMIRRIEQRMQALHQGEIDVTVVSPDAMVASISDILQMMTLAVAGIAAISLVVAGVLVMNLTSISVQQRTAEIGLLKAIGASALQVRWLFVAESLILAIAGCVVGLLITAAALWAGRLFLPQLSWQLPAWALVSVVVITIVTALLFTWRPASKAAGLSPTVALGRA